MEKQCFNLLNDYLFKLIFSEEKYLKLLLKEFFNIEFNKATYLNKEQNIINKNCKPGTVDLALKLDDEYVILELQVKKEKDFKERLLKYNTNNMCFNGIKVGENYGKLRSCRALAITNFKVDKNIKLNKVNLIQNEKYLYSDKFSIEILDLTNFINTCEIIMYKLFRFKTLEELEEIEKSTKDKLYLEIIRKIKYYNLDEKERLKMNKIAQMLMEEPNKRKIAYREGLNKGKTIGLNEGKAIGITQGKIEGQAYEKELIARNMLNKKLDINLISELTNLSKNKILSLK